MGKVITVEPTLKSQVQSHASFGFSCQVKLSDNEKMLISIDTREYDHATRNYVSKTEKVQLEELHYHTWNEVVTLSSVVARGFRKDGALRFRTCYVSSNNMPSVLLQIPAHYHDYAKEAFKKKMAELEQNLQKTIKNGIQL